MAKYNIGGMRGDAACAALVLGLMLTAGCSRQVAVPASASLTPPGDSEHLPFAKNGKMGGISPTSAVIPPGASIPAGTAVTVHVQSVISSATAHSGDAFGAVLEEPIVVNGQVLAERGAAVTGRVMEAKTAGLSEAPGYLRLTLDSIVVRGRSSSAQSSSAFVKGASPRKRDLPFNRDEAGRNALVGASAPGGTAYGVSNPQGRGTGLKDITVGPERQLIFRLTEPIPLFE